MNPTKLQEMKFEADSLYVVMVSFFRGNPKHKAYIKTNSHGGVILLNASLEVISSRDYTGTEHKFSPIITRCRKVDTGI